jgi:peptidoglycan/LPS O-acetylase OafA/YrhL
MGLIRIILAISVITAHSSDLFGTGFVGGELAVKLFFIISGFYMALVLNEKYVGENSGYWLFIKNRLLRLYPLYFLILFATILITVAGLYIKPEASSALTHYQAFGDSFTPGTWTYFGLVNVLLLGMESSLFLGIDTAGTLFFTESFAGTSPKVHSFLFVPQAWSISIELLFYSIAPFIARRLKLLGVLFLVSSLIALSLAMSDLPTDPWNYRFFPSQLMYFIIGSIGYFVYRKIKAGSFKVHSGLLWTAYVLTVMLTILFDPLTNFIDITVLSTGIIVLYSLTVPLIFYLSKRWKTDRYIGELSYSIYIIHILIIYCFKLVGISRIWIFGPGELVTIATIIASLVIQHIFLDKIERYRVVRS